METPATKEDYKKRGRLIEFVNAWIKEKRKFRGSMFADLSSRHGNDAVCGGKGAREIFDFFTASEGLQSAKVCY